MKEDQNWREPTEEERQMLHDHLVNQDNRTEEEASNALESAYMIVLENFVSQSPGYTERVLIVMYGYPESLEGYLFDEDAGGDMWDSDLHRFASP